MGIFFLSGEGTQGLKKADGKWMIKIGEKMQQKKGPGSGIMKKSRKIFCPFMAVSEASRQCLAHSRCSLLEHTWMHGLQRFLQCCILGCHTYGVIADECTKSHTSFLWRACPSLLWQVLQTCPGQGVDLIKSSETWKLIRESPWG